jgi:hypothetical protein
LQGAAKSTNISHAHGALCFGIHSVYFWSHRLQIIAGIIQFDPQIFMRIKKGAVTKVALAAT